jgi:hypothetical protein
VVEAAAEVVAPATVTKLVIGARALSVVSSDGSVRELSYLDAIAVLTSALGQEPAAERRTEHEEPGPFTLYDWDGFSVSVADTASAEPYMYQFLVQADAAEIAGISIETTEAIQVGDAAAGVASRYAGAVSEYTNDEGGVGFMARAEIVPVPDAPVSSGFEYNYAIELLAQDKTTVIVTITAPGANFLN